MSIELAFELSSDLMFSGHTAGTDSYMRQCFDRVRLSGTGCEEPG